MGKSNSPWPLALSQEPVARSQELRAKSYFLVPDLSACISAISVISGKVLGFANCQLLIAIYLEVLLQIAESFHLQQTYSIRRRAYDFMLENPGLVMRDEHSVNACMQRWIDI